MTKLQAFIEQMRTIADILGKYATENERQYPDIQFIPFAARWWSSIMTASYLLEYQETPLTKKQIHYLDRKFFGGMGSFQDFYFDEKDLGRDAEKMNNKIRQETTILYEKFKALVEESEGK